MIGLAFMNVEKILRCVCAAATLCDYREFCMQAFLEAPHTQKKVTLDCSNLNWQK